MRVSIKKQILEQVSKLPLTQQKLVLNSASSLLRKSPRGVPGKDLLTFAGCIEAADVEVMSKAIEQGCELRRTGSRRNARIISGSSPIRSSWSESWRSVAPACRFH